jgi:hypothetical protein
MRDPERLCIEASFRLTPSPALNLDQKDDGLPRDVPGSSKTLQIFGLQLAQWGSPHGFLLHKRSGPFIGGAKKTVRPKNGGGYI